MKVDVGEWKINYLKVKVIASCRQNIHFAFYRSFSETNYFAATSSFRSALRQCLAFIFAYRSCTLLSFSFIYTRRFGFCAWPPIFKRDSHCVDALDLPPAIGFRFIVENCYYDIDNDEPPKFHTKHWTYFFIEILPILKDRTILFDLQTKYQIGGLRGILNGLNLFLCFNTTTTDS